MRRDAVETSIHRNIIAVSRLALAAACAVLGASPAAAGGRSPSLKLEYSAVASGPPTRIRISVARHQLTVQWDEPTWGSWYTVELKTSIRGVGLKMPAAQQREMDTKTFFYDYLVVPIPAATEAAMKDGTYYARVCAYNKRGGACSDWVSSVSYGPPSSPGAHLRDKTPYHPPSPAPKPH